MENEVKYLSWRTTYIITTIIFICIILLLAGWLISLTPLQSSDIDYHNRFYKEALADFFQVQILMFPFNSNDSVTLEFGGVHNEIIFINHTEPNPDYTIVDKYVYRYIMHFDYNLTFEENVE